MSGCSNRARDTFNGTGVTDDCTHVRRAYRIPAEADTYASRHTGCPQLYRHFFRSLNPRQIQRRSAPCPFARPRFAFRFSGRHMRFEVHLELLSSRIRLGNNARRRMPPKAALPRNVQFCNSPGCLKNRSQEDFPRSTAAPLPMIPAEFETPCTDPR